MSLRSPEAETPRVRGIPAEIPEVRLPGLGGGATKAPTALKVSKQDFPKTCPPGTGTPPKDRAGPTPLMTWLQFMLSP